MTLTDFYSKYNLNHTYFASLTHVGVRTLKRYEANQNIRTEAKERIEKAMTTIIKYDLIRPKYDQSSTIGYWRSWSGMEFHVKLEKYERKFQQLMNEG